MLEEFSVFKKPFWQRLSQSACLTFQDDSCARGSVPPVKSRPNNSIYIFTWTFFVARGRTSKSAHTLFNTSFSYVGGLFFFTFLFFFSSSLFES